MPDHGGEHAVISDIGRRVLAIIGKQKDKDTATLSLNDDLTSLEVDSLDLVEIIFHIEEEFEVQVPQDMEVLGLKTVGDVVAGVERLMAQKAARAVAR